MARNRTPSHGTAPSWTARQEQAATLLASGHTVRGTAQAVGAGLRTVYDWLDNRAYKQYINSLRDEMLTQAVGQLSRSATAAVSTLVELLTDAESSVRLRASVAILDALLRCRELTDIVTRLTDLEALAHDKQKLDRSA